VSRRAFGHRPRQSPRSGRSPTSTSSPHGGYPSDPRATPDDARRLPLATKPALASLLPRVPPIRDRHRSRRPASRAQADRARRDHACPGRRRGPTRRGGAPAASPRQRGTFLEPDELNSLLDAAGQLEAEARSDQKVARREIAATIGLAGLRVSELCQLTWKQLDFAHARIQIPDAKTAAGIREVDMTPLLHEILLDYRTRLAGVDPAEPVFPTRSGKPRDKDNIRNRVLARCVEPATTARAPTCRRLVASRRTRFATPSSHCCWPTAPSCHTSWPRLATPTRARHSASTRRCFAVIVATSARRSTRWWATRLRRVRPTGWPRIGRTSGWIPRDIGQRHVLIAGLTS
jgi:integrase